MFVVDFGLWMIFAAGFCFELCLFCCVCGVVFGPVCVFVVDFGLWMIFAAGFCFELCLFCCVCGVVFGPVCPCIGEGARSVAARPLRVFPVLSRFVPSRL